MTVYNKNTAAAYFGTGTGTGTSPSNRSSGVLATTALIPEDVNGDGKTDVVLYNSATGTEYTGISNGSGVAGFTYTYQLWGPGKLLAR